MTCMSAFVVSTMTRELVLGSLNSGFWSSPMITSSGSSTCGCFPKLEFGGDESCNGSSTTSTSTLDILDLGVVTQPHGDQRLLLVGPGAARPRGREVNIGASPPVVRTV